MNVLLSALLSILLLTPAAWLTDFSKAKAQAQSEHKMILISFSGSDWCGPCIRMHKEVFDAPAFGDFATTNLVLVNADFPRMKKHQLPPDLVRHNKALAATYNPEGVFPLTVLLDEQGKVVKRWEGYPGVPADRFISELNNLVHAVR